ncbi:MAG: RHS repeat domain-containing protein, partial [Steroidobacter sp.]
GLFDSSAAKLGKNGVSGNSNLGQGNEQVYVNTATGNLVIQHQDDFLSAIGADLNIIRTYNSQGKLDDDNGDNWKIGLYRRVYNLAGTVNTAGSTITKVFGDGAEVVYTYDQTRGVYVSSEGDGANDTLSYNTSTSQWTWTDGSSRATENYDTTGKLTQSTDADGNVTSYSYTGTLLTQVTDSSGQVVHLDYSGNDLIDVRVVSNGQTQTLTHYTYDASGRLQYVKVDLSPGDNSIADGKVYTTLYTYDGSSERVASITQNDGTSVRFTYQLIDGQYRVKTYTDGNGKLTTLNYTQASTITTSGTPTTVNASSGALSTSDTTSQPYDINSSALSTTDTTNQTYNVNNGALSTTNTTTQSYGASNAALSTTSTTSQSYNVDGAALLTTDTEYKTYNVNNAALSTTGTSNQTYSINNSALSTTDTASQTYSIDNAALSTTDGTVQTYSVNSSALSTTSTTTQAYSLNNSVLSGGGGVSTPTYVQGNSYGVSSGSSVSTTFTGAQTAGNINIVVLSWFSQTPHAVTITDSSGNVYSLAASPQSASSGGTTSIYYAKNIAGAAANANTVTVTLDSSDSFVELSVAEYSGIDTVNPLDVSVGTSGVGTVANSGSVTTTNPNDLLFGDVYVSSLATTAGSGYTKRFQTYFGDGIEDKTVTSAGGYSVTMNQNASGWWVAQLAAFKAASSGAQTYTVPSGATWQSLANTLYGINSAEAGSALQTALGGGSVPSTGTVLSNLPATLSVSTTTTVPAYYLAPSGATWQSIANDVYGINSAAAGTALQTAMGGIAVPAANTQLTGLPSTLTVDTTTTVPAYYLVPSGATWQSIANAVYGVNSTDAGTALQTAMGNPSIATGTHLTSLPSTLTVSTTTT